MARLELSLLGTFRATLDRAAITAFGYDKVRALLAYLAVESDRPHHRESLAGLLWPEQPDQTARLNLSQALSRLRRILDDKSADPPFVDVTRQTLQFNPESDHWLDVAAFTAALEGCDQHTRDRLDDCEECLERLEAAAALYCGGFLEGFSIADSPLFEEWALLHRERLHRLALESLNGLVKRYEARGDYEKALPHAWRQVELDPWREEAQRALMRVLALSGQRGAALAQYEICRRLLAEELGVEPADETTALYQRIREGKLGRPEPAAILPQRRHNLPSQPTPFVGREDELSTIQHRLNDPDCRLLSLVGSGGIGKTRLAMQAAHNLLSDPPVGAGFEHGVTYVPLVAVSTPDALVATIASALDLAFYPGSDPKQQLLDYLRGKDMLLLLDNFEQLLAPVRSLPEPKAEARPGLGEGVDLVSDILANAPGVKLLITSREALQLRQEWFQPVAGLAFPPSEGVEADETTIAAERYSAVALFSQCARRAHPGFSLAKQGRWVVRICQLVEGMPLAIELAAAWLRAFPISSVAEELENDLDTLTASMHDVPARHHSIRVVFDQSWHRLSAEERDVMGALSVFRGGFHLGAARAVTGASLPLLAGLVEKSMLSVVSGDRYHIHELLRQYAARKLEELSGATHAARDRHCAYYAAAIESWAEALKSPRQREVLEEIETDVRNARLAWSWAVEHRQLARLDQALDGLCYFFACRGHYQEGESACRELAAQLESLAQPSTLELRVFVQGLAWQGLFQRTLGQIPRAAELLRKSLDLLAEPALADQDNRASRAFILREMAHIAAFSDREQARALGEESLALYRALDDRWGMASVLQKLATVALRLAEYDEAQRILEEAVQLQRFLGDRVGIADSLVLLTMVSAQKGLLDEAERLLQESIVVSKQSGNQSGNAEAIMTLASARALQGEFSEALRLGKKAACAFDELGRRRLLGVAEFHLSLINLNLGLYEKMHDTLQMRLNFFEQMGERQMMAECLNLESGLALVEEDYEAARIYAEKSTAIMQEIGQRGSIPWALTHLAVATLGLGGSSEARMYLCEALDIALEIRFPWGALTSIIGTALLMTGAGDMERGVELYALASSYPYFGNSRWWDDIAGKKIAYAVRSLSPEVVASCQERGRSFDLWETAEALLRELRAL